MKVAVDYQEEYEAAHEAFLEADKALHDVAKAHCRFDVEDLVFHEGVIMEVVKTYCYRETPAGQGRSPEFKYDYALKGLGGRYPQTKIWIPEVEIVSAAECYRVWKEVVGEK